ncbi:MAG: RNase adapter RapZ [Candidatus Thiosymbion ectosymbiont of Robbea hypermnestra]|nr:RNase adapter RapZ [Candidatus Thiosymbion ectosymbiont of Robbea hypermnestra]
MSTKKLVIVSGLSGSGKSIALHTLEDLGYYCIDNLPVFLLQELVEGLTNISGEAFAKTAVGIDARNQPQQLDGLPKLLERLCDGLFECRVLYLEARTETLIKRFSETRRRHPLTDPERPLAEAIEIERKMLEPILSDSDLRIDTTHTNVHQLRDLVCERLRDDAPHRVSLLLQTFGFKHGIPHDVDFVFDVRCLPNPYWQPELRPLTGQDPAVARFLDKTPEVVEMRTDLMHFFDRWISRFEADGRSYLTVAIGCTGGRHRSVYIAERLKEHFKTGGHKVMVRHRELS